MNLLFVHQHLGAMGGAEVTLLNTARELKRIGHSVSLMYVSETGKGRDEWLVTFDSCHRLAGRGNVEHIEATLEELRPDLLFINNLDDLIAFGRLLESGLPVVRMVHDHALYCMRQYKYNYFTRQVCTRATSAYCVFPCLAHIQRNRGGLLPIKLVSYAEKLKELALNRRCQKLFVYSDYCRQELVRNGFNKEDIHLYAPVASDRGDFPTSSFSDRNLILFAGQIIRGKGVDVLLRSLKKVRVPCECVILGDGSHRNYCERLCGRLGLNDRVRFLGYVAPEQMRVHYLEASVFAVSSLWPEPFGLVGPEAMRYGLPVVAFDAGGIKEWLIHEENGLIAPWMDADVYARNIERLLTDKELARRMGVHGRERVFREYNLEHQVARLERVFVALTNQGERSTRNENAGLNAVHGNR